MIRNKDMIIEIEYKFSYVGARGNIETIKDATEYDNIKEVEFIFNRLTSIGMVDFAALPVEIREAHIKKLVAFRDRINALASDKVKEFNNIHTNMR